MSLLSLIINPRDVIKKADRNALSYTTSLILYLLVIDQRYVLLAILGE